MVIAMLLTIIPFAALAEAEIPTINEALNVAEGTLKFNAKDWEVVVEEAEDMRDSDDDPVTPEGRVYARSTNHDDDSSSQIKLVAEVNAGDILTFEAKTSCEENYDGLEVAVDGEAIALVTGETDWEDYYYIFEEEGTYVVTWKYIKDTSDYDGEDCAYLDNIYLGENSFELEDIKVADSFTLIPGYTAVIDVKPVPSFADLGTVTFEVENEEVATVDEQGVITAVDVGETIIKVKTDALPELEKTIDIHVVEPKLANAFLIYDDGADEDTQYGLVEVEVNTGLYKMKLTFDEFLQTYLVDTWFGPTEVVESVYAAEYLDGMVYMFTDAGRFVVIDAESYKVETEIGDLETGEGLQADFSIVDMAFDYTTYTMYALAWSNTEDGFPYIVSIDLETGAVDPITQLPFNTYELAANNGKLYTVAGDGMLYSVSPDGEALELGQLDIAPSYLQTLAFNHETGELYWLGIGADAYADPEEAEAFSFTGAIDVEKGELSYTVHETLMEFTGLYFEFEDPTEKIAVTGVELDQTEVEIKWGETVKLNATVTPEDATNKRVRWTSSDETVATVMNGVVKAVGDGEAVITATTVDGGFTAECKVTVTGAPTYLLNESFEPAKDETYQVEGWKVIDADNDGYGWEAYAVDGIAAYDGVGVYVSQSYINDIGALTPDNWLISPSFTADEQSVASWYVAAQDPAYADENYEVYVIPAEYAVEDLAGLTPVYSGMSTGSWVNVTADLAEYAGQEVRLAFRHCNTTDMYWIKLDLVQVYTFAEQAPVETVTVTFVDGNTEEVIATVEVEKGADVEFPEVPEHEGFFFIGWDNEGKEIAEDTTITAQYMAYGDVNGDGKINTADATVILKYSAEMIDLDENELIAGDVNFDGKVTTADAVLVLKYAAEMIDGFPKPVEE